METTDNTKKTTRNKWLSTKWLLTLWSVFLISFIVVGGKTELYQMATVAMSIPLAYIGANVLQKKIYADADEEEQTE